MSSFNKKPFLKHLKKMLVKPGDEVDSRAHYPTSHGGIREAGLIEVSEESKPPLIWIDGTITMKTAENLLPYQRANKIPCMDYLCYKSTLFSELNLIKKQYPNVFNFYPDTFILPNDFPEFQRKHTFICSRTSVAPTWVVKPKNGCCGKGIQLISSTYEAEGISDQSVAQLYIHPYLLDGVKFDFRFFVLISTLDPLTVFIYNEGIARFCTEQYQPPNKTNKNHQFSHLTNTAINKGSTKNPEEFTRKASETLNRFGGNKKNIWNNIKRATGLFVAGLYPAIIKLLPQPAPKIPRIHTSKPRPSSSLGINRVRSSRSPISARRILPPAHPKKQQINSSHLQEEEEKYEKTITTEKDIKETTEMKDETQTNNENNEIKESNDNNENKEGCDKAETPDKEQSKEDNKEGEEQKDDEKEEEKEEEINLKDINMPIPKKFYHILGIDIMIDDHMNPQVLELNDRPSLAVTVPFEMELKTAMIRDSFKHITHDGSPVGEVEGSGWEQILPAPTGSELDNYSKIAMERKCTLKYTGRAGSESPTTVRMIESGINQKLHQERRERFENLKQSMKAPKFHNYTKIIL